MTTRKIKNLGSKLCNFDIKLTPKNTKVECSVCYNEYTKNSFNCTKCNHMDVCINCINNSSERTFGINPFYSNIKDRVINFEEDKQPQIVFKCPLCRELNQLNLFDLKKEEILQLVFMDFINHYHLNETNGKLEDETYNYKTKIDEYHNLYFNKDEQLLTEINELQNTNDILLKECHLLANIKEFNNTLLCENKELKQKLDDIELKEKMQYASFEAYQKVNELHITNIKDLFHNSKKTNSKFINNKLYISNMDKLLLAKYDCKINMTNTENEIIVKQKK